MKALIPTYELLCSAARPRSPANGLVLPLRSFSSSSNVRTESEERRKARERAWYLSDPTPSTSSPTPSHSARTPPPSPGAATVPAGVANPRFTTFDPLSTTSSTPSPQPIAPLPSGAPKHFSALHAFLTTHPEVVIPHSVKFLYAPGGAGATDPDAIEVIRAGSGDGQGAKGRFDWVVVAQVEGRGRGVVGRAERMLSLWLQDNPIAALNTSRSRSSKLDLDSDWALIPIGPSSDSRTAVNLFTEDGLARWDLESLWAPSSPRRFDQ